MQDRPQQMIFVPYWMLWVAAPIFGLIALACALAGRWVFVPVWLLFGALWVWLGFINRRRLRELERSRPGTLGDADLDPDIGVRAVGVLALAFATVVVLAAVMGGILLLLSR